MAGDLEAMADLLDLREEIDLRDLQNSNSIAPVEDMQKRKDVVSEGLEPKTR
jgi:hypothetical protein